MQLIGLQPVKLQPLPVHAHDEPPLQFTEQVASVAVQSTSQVDLPEQSSELLPPEATATVQVDPPEQLTVQLDVVSQVNAHEQLFFPHVSAQVPTMPPQLWEQQPLHALQVEAHARSLPPRSLPERSEPARSSSGPASSLDASSGTARSAPPGEESPLGGVSLWIGRPETRNLHPAASRSSGASRLTSLASFPS